MTEKKRNVFEFFWQRQGVLVHITWRFNHFDPEWNCGSTALSLSLSLSFVLVVDLLQSRENSQLVSSWLTWSDTCKRGSCEPHTCQNRTQPPTNKMSLGSPSIHWIRRSLSFPESADVPTAACPAVCCCGRFSGFRHILSGVSFWSFI
jgi:hypothetical protein